jgi:hypothetical protein
MPDTHNELDDFIRQETTNAGIIDNYLRDAKSNYVTPDFDISQLGRNSSLFLWANNTDARIACARLVVENMAPVVSELVEAGENAYFVTLTPKQFAMPESAAHTFAPEALEAWIRRLVRKVDYLGVIEAGLYPRLKDLADPKCGTVSWHAHLVVWNVGREKLSSTLGAMALTHESLLREMPPFHVKTVPPDDIVRCLLYGLKTPQKQYATWAATKDKIDPDTGEFLLVTKDNQRSAMLRPGQRVKMCNVLRDQYLDRLLVSGGAGDRIRKTVREKLLKQFDQMKKYGK